MMTDAYMLPSSPITGELQFIWIENNGDVHNLSKIVSPNLWVHAGSSGLGDAEFEIESDKLPSGAGSLIRKINTSPRKMILSIIANADNIGELIPLAEDLHDWFDTGDESEKRPGTLRIIRPDDTTRDIEAYYLRGLEGNTGEGGPNWAQYPIELFAPDPYPTEPEFTVLLKDAAEAASFAIINQGRLETFPVITLSGDFTNFVIRNETRSVEENADIEIVGTHTSVDPNSITIDTRPSEIRPGFSVYDNTGANKISVISPGSVFWSLKPGSNLIQITFTAHNPLTVSVVVSYLARFRSLLR